MKTTYLLAAAVATAAVVGFAFERASKPTVISEEVRTSGELADPTTDPSDLDGPSDDQTAIRGKVIETIDVPSYTYLHLQTTDGDKWAAVQTAKVAKGSTVSVTEAVLMRDFQSSTLNRTFSVIYFGQLGGAAGAQPPPVVGTEALPPGHPPIGEGDSAMPPFDPQTAGHPAVAEEKLEAIPKIEPTSGENGGTIASLFSRRDQLTGKLVRVRGAVVRVTPGVQGRTYLHLSDGSGSAQEGNSDLAATTSATPTKGEVVTLEGTLNTDVDVGTGSPYPILLENCKVTK